MERGRKVAVVAHCLLNVNTKVHGLAVYPAVHPVVGELLATGVGLVQLPCPEVAHLGMARWGMTREQYDIPAYRRLCQKLVEPIVDTLTALVADGCEVVGVWGVDGSPSCGVDRTCVGYEGGEVERLLSLPCCVQVPEEGVFISILRSSLVKRGLELSFHAVPEDGA